MDLLAVSETFYSWVLIPALIFTARLADVTVGTLRIVFLSRGRKYVAPVLGFFELLIWLLAIGQVMQNLSNPLCYIAYAGGFAAGNFAGLLIEERIAAGLEVLRVITSRQPAGAVVDELRAAGFGVTEIPAEGARGPVSVLFMIIRRKNRREALDLVHRHHPKAFFTIEDVRAVQEGVFPPYRTSALKNLRKGK